MPPFIQTILQILVFLIYLGMAATQRWDDFRDALKTPKAFVVGMLCQFVLMPVLAFTIAKTFDFSNLFAIGLILIGCCPGGGVSNLLTYAARGNVALSISMTTASTMASLFMMPILLFIWATPFTDATIKIPYGNIIKILVWMVIPVSLGILAKHKSAKIAKWLTWLGTAGGTGFILFTIYYTFFVKYAWVCKLPLKVHIAVIGLSIAGFILGYVLARVLGLTHKNCRAVSMETGIQLAPLGALIAAISFPKPESFSIMLVPWFYGIYFCMAGPLTGFVMRMLSYHTDKGENQSTVN